MHTLKQKFKEFFKTFIQEIKDFSSGNWSISEYLILIIKLIVFFLLITWTGLLKIYDLLEVL